MENSPWEQPKYVSVVLPSCGVHARLRLLPRGRGEGSLDKYRYPPGVDDRTHGGLSVLGSRGAMFTA